jgi:dihydroorotate dehydrogenase (fumarate)
MISLRRSISGLTLRSPLVASAGPLTGNPEMWERIERAGAGAIVLPSLFEEQIERDVFVVDHALDNGTNAFAEALTYLPNLDDGDIGPYRHIALVELARECLTIPVIASLNGTTPGGWVRYARHLADAGAHAIELNLYDVVVDPRVSAADVERRYLDLVEQVKQEVKIPLAVKIGPWFTALAHFAVALQHAGADGLVRFNRLYQLDIDLDTKLAPNGQATNCRRRSSASVALDRSPQRRHHVLTRGDERSRRRRRVESCYWPAPMWY